ncbi:MAG: hypothetical protein RLY31_2534 [Bacteroidota bacterium]|jgi:xanthine/uracil permease
MEFRNNRNQRILLILLNVLLAGTVTAIVLYHFIRKRRVSTPYRKQRQIGERILSEK